MNFLYIHIEAYIFITIVNNFSYLNLYNFPPNFFRRIHLFYKLYPFNIVIYLNYHILIAIFLFNYNHFVYYNYLIFISY
jgi:hypothetical protein